jgi:pyridoxal phosphate-dependent aminotransferase EpsN
LQPLYSSLPRYRGEVAEDLFRRGICLPSSSSLSRSDQQRVISEIAQAAAYSKNRLAHCAASVGYKFATDSD